MLSQQLLRFIIVGLTTNGALLGVFWVLTTLGTPPLVAVTAVYVIGLIASLVLNGTWTFRSLNRTNAKVLTVRFVVLYGLGYLYSMAAFWAIALTGLDHTLTQLLVMGSCAVLLFLGQKYLVFHNRQTGK